MVIRPLLILALFLAQPGAAVEFCVGANGSDANPGTRAKPFATLERARDAVRQLRQDGKPTKSGVTIWLRGGDYLRTNALELTCADSGTPERPITLRAQTPPEPRRMEPPRREVTALFSRLSGAGRGSPGSTGGNTRPRPEGEGRRTL